MEIDDRGDRRGIGCHRRPRRFATFVEPIGQLLLDPFEEMAVDPEGNARVGVAHPLGHGQNVGAVINQEARMSVADVVGAELLG